MSGVKYVKIDLAKDSRLAEDLEEIKRHYGLSDYTNAVRIAISQLARKLREQKVEVTG